MVAFTKAFASPRKSCSPRTHTPWVQVQLSGLRYYKPELGRGLRRWVYGGDEEPETTPHLLLQTPEEAILNDGTVEAGSWWCFSDDEELTPKEYGVPKIPRTEVYDHPKCRHFDECAQRHEDDHERTLGPACDAAVEAYERAKHDVIKRRNIKGEWKRYRRENIRRSECQAYKVSEACFEEYYGKYGCDCPYEDGCDEPEGVWRSCCDLSVNEAALQGGMRRDRCRFGDKPLDDIPDFSKFL